MRLKICGLLTVAAMACCSTAQAQPTLQFAFGVNGTITNSFNIPNVGGTVPVTLYMLDNGGTLAGYTPNPGQPLNTTLTGNLRTNGLTGFGVRLTSTFGSVARVTNSSAIAEFNPIVPGGPPNFNNQAFGFNFTTTKTAGFDAANDRGIATLVSQRLGDGAIDPPVPPQYIGQVPVTDASPAAPAGRVELGTFTFTAFANGTAVVSLVDPDTGNGNTALGNFTSPGTNGGLVLDPVGGTSFLFGQTFTINVGVVPEPSSMILGGMALAGIGALRLRRKKVKTEETAAV